MAIENSAKKGRYHGGRLLRRLLLLLSLMPTALLPAPKSAHAYPYYLEEHGGDPYLPSTSYSSSTVPSTVAYDSTTVWEREGNRILHRLVGDDSHSFLGFHPRITVIGANLPLAVLRREDGIVLSTGLLNILESEEEFAFLIAHELAHKLLEHDKEVIHITHSNSAWEEEADMLALQLLRGGNMGGRGAAKLLQKLVTFGSGQGFQLGDYYPTLRKRSTFLARQNEQLPRL